MPTVSLAPSASAFLGLTFLTALLATLSAFALTLGLAEVFCVERSTPSVDFFAAETAFLAVALGFAAAFLAVAVAFFAVAFFAGAFFLVGEVFLVMPAALVRAPAVLFFFFWGEGAAGLGARALAFSWGGKGQISKVVV